MLQRTVRCNKCGAQAKLKAILPASTSAERTSPSEAPRAVRPRGFIYCPRCGMRTQTVKVNEG